MLPAQSTEDADVVVLNTCCIRENADNRLYGNLGQLRAVKERRPGMQIAVGGCLAQKDRGALLERAPWVDAVFGTHNVGHAAELLERARTEGPVMEILDAAATDREEFPSVLPVRREMPFAAWVTIQVGCDNRCAFCIVPAVRGREISRPFAEVVSEVSSLAERGTVEVTLLGQNVNSYGRDLALAARSSTDWRAQAYMTGERWADRRCSPGEAALRRPVDCRGGGGGDRAGALSPARTQRISAPRRSRPWPRRGAFARTCTCRCSLGSDRVLAMMRRGYTAGRYLERLAAARSTIEDLAVTTDIIVGFPGETEDDFEQTLEVAAEAQYDSAYTFLFSPRPGHRRCPAHRRVRRARGGSGALRALTRGCRAQRPAPSPGTGGARRGGARRGAGQKGRPGALSRGARDRTSSFTSTGKDLRAGMLVEVLIEQRRAAFPAGKSGPRARPAQCRKLIPVAAGTGAGARDGTKVATALKAWSPAERLHRPPAFCLGRHDGMREVGARRAGGARRSATSRS